MRRKPAVRVVQLTPPGRGAIATLLIEGPGAVELLARYFRPNHGRAQECRPGGQLLVGRLGAEPGEEVVVRRRSDESVELHCHGGRAAVAMIQEVLAEGGARVVAWRDWLHDHHRDPIAAAAHAALADARTERTAAILLDQYQGALRRAMERIEEALARRDFPSASRQIDALLARAELGRHLTRPWRVVLTGRANVGKSSLINALLGYPRAIVHHRPGTTRDVLSTTAALDGWPVELSDTAGLPEDEDASGALGFGPSEAAPCSEAGSGEADAALQRAGLRRAGERLAEADLVVLVFDASRAFSGVDQSLIETWPGGLVVHNKSDLRPAPGPRPAGLSTSALTGAGVEALGRAMAECLVPNPPPLGAGVPFAAEQVAQLAAYRLRANGEERSSDQSAGGRRRS